MILSLFPGIDLLGHAFELEGYTVVRGPDPIFGGDIRTFHPPEAFEGVIGGPPCQSFSNLVNLVRAQGHEPKFGNLIPEFERCVAECRPVWFLMENVPQAPLPAVPGYVVHDQILNNRWLGEEQHRVRRWCFGSRDGRRLAIETLALESAMFSGTVVGDLNVPRSSRQWSAGKATVTANVGGRGKGGEGKARVPRTVTGSDGGASKKMWRYKVPEALELQGLPADYLDHCPFTAAGKLQAIANGVPIPMGRALARAVRATTTTERGLNDRQ